MPSRKEMANTGSWRGLARPHKSWSRPPKYHTHYSVLPQTHIQMLGPMAGLQAEWAHNPLLLSGSCLGSLNMRHSLSEFVSHYFMCLRSGSKLSMHLHAYSQSNPALPSPPAMAERFPKQRREKKTCSYSLLVAICRTQRKKYVAQQGPCCILYGISVDLARPICLSVYKL